MSGTLAGAALTAARVTVPAWGRPWVDVDVATELTLAVGSAQTVKLADIEIKCVVVSGGSHAGKSAFRLVCGNGTWGKTIPRRSYMSDSLVRLSAVLGDAATACGETLTGAPTTRLATHYARPEGPAVDVLNALVPRGWYTELDGVTHVGARAATTYRGDAPRTRVDPASGVIELATETLAGLLPGVAVDGSAPATDVEYVLTSERLTARVWAGPAPTSRRLSALLQIVRTETARMRFLGVTEFRVVSQTLARLNLQPVRVATGFGDLEHVPVRPGIPGVKAMHALGSLVLVAFVDGDPSRPCVVSHSAEDDPGWMPISLDIGGPGALGVARITDTVQAGPFAGVITLGSARIKASL